MGAAVDIERMAELLARWDEALRAELPPWARLVPGAQERGSLLKRPATEGQIAAAEERLGIFFPPSYRAFLAVSNGAYAGKWMEYVQRGDRLWGGYLLGADEIVPLTVGDPVFIQVWLDEGIWDDIGVEQELPSAGQHVSVVDPQPARNGLMITENIQNAVVSIVPFPSEWQLWELDHSWISAHASFADWIEHQTKSAIRRLESVDDDAALAAVSEGRLAAIENLARSSYPGWMDVAFESILNPDFAEDQKASAVAVLQYVGDVRACEPLRQALTKASSANLRVRILEALDHCGDPDALELLKAAASTGQDADLREYATRYLKDRDQLPRW